MLDETSISLLKKIFGEGAQSAGINAQKFRAENHEYLDQIDSLESDGYIENREGKYSLRLTTLLDIADSTPQVESLLYLCQHLFEVLRQAYLNNPGGTVLLGKLAEFADLPREKIYPAIPYLSEASMINGYSTNFNADDAFVTPTERSLRYKSFSERVEEMRGWRKEPVTTHGSLMSTFASSTTLFGNELAFQDLLHASILEHAYPKYVNGDLRNAVLDSVIAVFDLIRVKTGLKGDGEYLINEVFSLKDPYLILSELETDSGLNDQKGFIQIFKGVFQGVRNPKAHTLSHDLTPTAAAQYLVLTSLLARRIDEAKVVKSFSAV